LDAANNVLPSPQDCGSAVCYRRPNNSTLSWIIYTFSPGAVGRTPTIATISLEYSLGPWTDVASNIWPDIAGGLRLGAGTLMAIGQNARGKAFVTLTRDPATQIRCTATTKDGQELDNSGTLWGPVADGSSRVERDELQFDLPLDQIKAFCFRMRPIKTVEFKNVSLRPEHESAAGSASASSSPPQQPSATTAFSAFEQVISADDADKQGLVFFSLETCKLYKPPFPLTIDLRHFGVPPVGSSSFVDLNPEQKKWIAARHVDLLYHLGNKHWENMFLETEIGFAGPANEWDTIGRQQIVDVFRKREAEGLLRQTASGVGDYRGDWGLCEGFRTRTGAIGVLQEQGFENGASHSLRVRYRLFPGRS
jgi:hypothetical protein